jgi:hypothetical protein
MHSGVCDDCTCKPLPQCGVLLLYTQCLAGVAADVQGLQTDELAALPHRCS